MPEITDAELTNLKNMEQVVHDMHAALGITWGDDPYAVIGRLKRTLEASRDVYYAAHWVPDRQVDAPRLWEELRDAAGFMRGKSPKPLGIDSLGTESVSASPTALQIAGLMRAAIAPNQVLDDKLLFRFAPIIDKIIDDNGGPISVAKAMQRISSALAEDTDPGSYYDGWVANIAMPIYDQRGKLDLKTHKDANIMAEKLMDHIFGITRKVRESSIATIAKLDAILADETPHEVATIPGGEIRAVKSEVDCG